jgi:hypothetical protein
MEWIGSFVLQYLESCEFFVSANVRCKTARSPGIALGIPIFLVGSDPAG